MRRAAVLLAAMLLAPGMVAGQEQEMFRDSFKGAPELYGYVSDEGMVVLDDGSYCAYILGGAFGSGSDISTDILRWELKDNGYSKKAVNKALKEYGKRVVTDELLLDACAYTLAQFRYPDVSYFEAKYPDNPAVAEAAPEPPEWQAMPVIPASVMQAMDEGRQ